MRALGRLLVMVFALALALGFMASVCYFTWSAILGAQWALWLLGVEALALAYLIYYWIRSY